MSLPKKATIVIYLVLQSTPTYVNAVAGYSIIWQASMIWDLSIFYNLALLTIAQMLNEQFGCGSCYKKFKFRKQNY